MSNDDTLHYSSTTHQVMKHIADMLEAEGCIFLGMLGDVEIDAVCTVEAIDPSGYVFSLPYVAHSKQRTP